MSVEHSEPDSIRPSYAPGLPNPRAGRKFEALPRRTSPLPWDTKAQEAYWASKPKNLEPEPGINTSNGSQYSYRWFDMLVSLQVGESLEVEASKVAVFKGVSYHMPKLKRRFEIAELGMWRYRVTRVG